jgi:MoaA/NifB/PqqE/SkfB family radical SAM enzyme
MPPVTEGSVNDHVAHAPVRALETLWIQVTGTWCNLECTHCLNASGPRAPWLKPLAAGVVRRHLADAAALGVGAVYFTGGEPFLHPALLPLLAEALAIAPATVLTNGTLVDDAAADALAAIAARGRYSLEIRVSLDDPDAAVNDAVRGPGSHARALEAVRRLEARGLVPIVTATDLTAPSGPAARAEAFVARLAGAGVARPRLKLLPVFPVGRAVVPGAASLDPERLEGVDLSVLQCVDGRAVADGGVYACPILAGLPGARLGSTLREAMRPAALFHPACLTCVETGASCRNG